VIKKLTTLDIRVHNLQDLESGLQPLLGAWRGESTTELLRAASHLYDDI
jgi:hypothetical protein